jgi:hypothetical protein
MCSLTSYEPNDRSLPRQTALLEDTNNGKSTELLSQSSRIWSIAK